MFRPLRDWPIKQTLLATIMATVGAALMVAGSGVVLTDTILYRRTVERDLAALSNIIADNTTAALTFDNPDDASQTLATLHSRRHTVTACVYSRRGTIFASYSRAGSGAACPSAPPASGDHFTGSDLVVSRPILLEGRPIGTLVLRYDLGEVGARIRLYSAIIFGILLVSSLVALLISMRLRAAIASPISHLAEAAASITETGDYGIRVSKQSNDELGILVGSFNEMLRRIQSRDVELQNARNSFETTLASIGDAVVATDMYGRIVFANPVARSLLRQPDDDILGKPIAEVFRIVNEFTRAEVESPVDRVLREGIIVGPANHTILIAGDGTEIPIDDSAAPIRHEGRIAGVVLVFRDITERRREQQDAAWLAAIVQSSDEAIVGKSPDGVIQSWNAGAERLYGYRAEEVIGRPMMDLLPTDRRHEESDILERLRHGGRVLHLETERVRKDGARIDVSLTISPIRDRAGQVVGVSHVARDITEEKRLDEQMRQTQKLESLGVLAGGIAHDFNNLLTGILGNTSLALDQVSEGSSLKPLLEDAIAASERAAQLARQMLAYSGKGHFVLEHLDLSEQVRSTLPLIRAAVPPNVALRLELAEALPVIEADATQLHQLIMNIIINAAEAVPERTPGTVTITTRPQPVDEAYIRAQPGVATGELRPGPYALFDVTDTGCGMDEATRARIFDPFFTTKFTGRGLGLAAALGIVRGHHGFIRVQSAPGQGTTFQVLFPAVREPQRLTSLPSEPDVVSIGDGGLVLVVDDEEIVRNMARGTLEHYGYRVLLAQDGKQGLEIFRREAANILCVVLDLTMPVMGGEETLAALQAIRPDVAVILSSGFNEVQAVRRFEGKGLAGFLQKPYKPAALVEKIAGAARAHSGGR